jgi:hypothetical protein
MIEGNWQLIEVIARLRQLDGAQLSARLVVAGHLSDMLRAAGISWTDLGDLLHRGLEARHAAARSSARRYRIPPLSPYVEVVEPIGGSGRYGLLVDGIPVCHSDDRLVTFPTISAASWAVDLAFGEEKEVAEVIEALSAPGEFSPTK